VIFKESTQCKGKSVREIYDIYESGLIYGDEIWEVRGGSEITDWIQKNFFERVSRMPRKTTNGAAEW